MTATDSVTSLSRTDDSWRKEYEEDQKLLKEVTIAAEKLKELQQSLEYTSHVYMRARNVTKSAQTIEKKADDLGADLKRIDKANDLRFQKVQEKTELLSACVIYAVGTMIALTLGFTAAPLGAPMAVSVAIVSGGLAAYGVYLCTHRV